MTGQEIIDFIKENDMQDKDVMIYFAYEENSSSVAIIKSIGVDADDSTTFIDIGNIDDLLFYKK